MGGLTGRRMRKVGTLSSAVHVKNYSFRSLLADLMSLSLPAPASANSSSDDELSIAMKLPPEFWSCAMVDICDLKHKSSIHSFQGRTHQFVFEKRHMKNGSEKENFNIREEQLFRDQQKLRLFSFSNIHLK